MEQEFCESCQAILSGCKAKKEDMVFDDEGNVISCKMYMKRVRPGHCVNCESGGRIY